MRPTATADGEAGDKPGRISLIAGGSRSEPNKLTGDQVHRTNETPKTAPMALKPIPGQSPKLAVTVCQCKRRKEINRSGVAWRGVKEAIVTTEEDFIINQGFDP